MSVYREGYYIVEQYEAKKVQIWPDSADEGVPVKSFDLFSKQIKQLVDWYGIKETRKVSNERKEVSIEVELLNEWRYSDDRGDGNYKSMNDYKDRFRVFYHKFSKRDLNHPLLYGKDGFYSIERTN